MATSPTCESKIFKHGFTKENIQNVYLLPFTTTKDIKLTTIQYKVIYNILPNQVSLFRTGIANNDTCPLCNANKKTNQQSPACFTPILKPPRFGVSSPTDGIKNLSKT